MTEFKSTTMKPTHTEKGTSQKSSLFNVEENEVIRNKRSIPWVRLEEGLHTSGCPLCEIVLKSAHKHLDSLLYEYVNDVSVRKKLHASFGFCNHHAWLAKEVERELNSDGQHLATLHESLLKAELRLLQEASGTKRIAAKKKETDPIVEHLLKTVEPKGECLLCASDRQTEEFYASQFVLMYSDDEFRSLFEADTILMCRPHFLSLMHETHDRAAVAYFLHEQTKKLERLLDQLKLFLEKHDVHRQHEPRGKEWTSWLQVLEHFSCKQGIDRLRDPYSPSNQNK